MRSRTRTAFTLTVISFLSILTGWYIPFWFGRFYTATRSKQQWGLFYTIICKIGNCTTVAGILDNVDFSGGETTIHLQALAVVATLAFCLCLLGFLTVLTFHFHVCGKTFSYHNFVTGATILQLTAALFVFVTIIISGIATGQFFSVTPMDSVIEFPWSLLCYCIGEVFLVTSSILYLLITCDWYKYRAIYARKRYLVDDIVPIEPPPDYDMERRQRYKSFDNDSFVGYFRGSEPDLTFTDTNTKQKSLPRRHDNFQGYLPTSDMTYYTFPDRRSRTSRHSISGPLSGTYLPFTVDRAGPSRAKSYGNVYTSYNSNPRSMHVKDPWEDPTNFGLRDVYM